MTNDELHALRAAAEAATPGPWEHIQTGGGHENYVYAPNARYGVSWAGESPVKVAYMPMDPSGPRDACDAAYIAAANPATILRLLAHVDALAALPPNAKPSELVRAAMGIEAGAAHAAAHEAMGGGR